MNWSNGLGQTECGHLGAAAYYGETGNFDVFHVNPPLTRMVVSVPIAICKPNLDFKMYSPRPVDRSEWDIGVDFIEANTRSKIRWCTFWARSSLIPFLLLGGYCGFLFSRDLYGTASAYLFLVLWCFSPFMLSWGATVCPDATAAAMGLVAVYSFRSWILDPTANGAAVAGITLGILPLAKLTWVIAFVVWPLIWVALRIHRIRNSKERNYVSPILPAKQLGMILVLGILTINLGYGFDRSFQRLGEYEFNSEVLGGSESERQSENKTVPGNRFHHTILKNVPIPLPAEFIQGIDTQKRDFEKGLPSYLCGEWANHGWWYYYLYALAVKEPLGTWCLFTLSVFVTVLCSAFNASFRDELIVLVPGMAILVFVSSQTGFSVNTRYVILALPFFYLWVSKLARVFQADIFGFRNWALAGAVSTAITWSVISSLVVYPHSLSYFNELVGGPKSGGRYLLGSNFDWGQDVWYLKAWLDDHPEVELDGNIFQRSYTLTVMEIPETGNPPPSPTGDVKFDDEVLKRLGPKPGWYVLSANHLYGRDGKYRYFVDHFKPVAHAGYSIQIYKITLREANRVRKKMGLPGTQSTVARQATGK